MNSGTRISSIASLVFLGAFAAADAGRVGEDGTGAMWVAPELVDAMDSAWLTGCTDLQTNGRVTFEWHPATGELTFATDAGNAAVTLPEGASPAPLNLSTAGCGSR